MNGKLAKRLRRMAREEMEMDKQMYGAKDRELVIATIKGRDRVINDPMTVRGMTLALKASHKKASQAGRI